MATWSEMASTVWSLGRVTGRNKPATIHKTKTQQKRTVTELLQNRIAHCIIQKILFKKHNQVSKDSVYKIHNQKILSSRNPAEVQSQRIQLDRVGQRQNQSFKNQQRFKIRESDLLSLTGRQAGAGQKHADVQNWQNLWRHKQAGKLLL